MIVKINCGILEGDLVRFLKEYFPDYLFKQRKSYDEYYVENGKFDCDIDIDILRIISERLEVEIQPDVIIISNIL